MLALLLACGAAVSCGEEDDACPPVGTHAMFDPTLTRLGSEAATWLAYPFPSDHRRRANGHPRLSDFPNPDGAGLVARYTTYAEEALDGFGLNGPVYVAFSGQLAPGSLPTPPEAYVTPSAPIQLVDVTPTSPEYGLRRPLVWQYWAEAGELVPARSLAVAPAWGFSLREHTTYALIVTSAVRDAAGEPLVQPPLLARLLGRDLPASCGGSLDGDLAAQLREELAPLRELLAHDGIDASRVVAATVFTTQGVTSELAAIRDQITGVLEAPAARDDSWRELGGSGTGVYHRTQSFQWNSTETVSFHVMEGRFTSPNYQHGSLPYASPPDGGAFLFEDGVPQPDHFEELRFVLTIPAGPPPDGGQCYPIVEYAHGTGGDAYTFASETGGRLAARGLAGISIDQPLHGPRAEGKSFDVTMMSFNFLNPSSARAIFRQSAADTFSLTRFVRESLRVPAEKSPTGESICFAPERIGLFGHSQGGLTGAIAAAYESDIEHWVLSGAGGGLSITLLERKDVADFAALLALLLMLDEDDERLSELHPAVALLQMVVDVTDPINYAPFWLDQPGLAPPKSVFMTSGLDDEATPYRAATALAVSGRVPVVDDVVLPIREYDWAGVPHATAPVLANVGEVTAGFIQWGPSPVMLEYDSHFLIFYRPEAINASMRFLESAAYGYGPVIERDASADVR